MVKDARFVSISKLWCLQKICKQVFYRNVLTLHHHSETKNVNSFIFIDLLVNRRMNFITLTNLEMNLDNSFHSKRFLTTLIGDFSAKSKEWSKGDRSTMEWSQIKFLNFQFRRCKIKKQKMRRKLFFFFCTQDSAITTT